MEFRTITRLNRSREIILILLKYGYDDLVHRLDLPAKGFLKKIQYTDKDVGTYERIRHVLEDLGPTFIKFGQIVSLRPDLLPPPVIKELSKLQDDVSPVEFEKIKKVVEQGLGRPLKDVFTIFDSKPIAAASVSQVHRGVLKKEGAIVGIKVQRPGIRRILEADLDILEALADRIHDRSDDLRGYNLPNLVRVTRRNLLREIDFTKEARNMKIARTNTAETSNIYIPEVYEDYCSEKVLVMEYIQGAKLRDTEINALEDPISLAKMGLKAAMKQILEDGFFHADPHPGNILISSEKGLCLVDWGMIGRLTKNDRRDLVDLIKAIVEKNSSAMVMALTRIGCPEKPIDDRSLEIDLLDVLDYYFAVPLKDLNVGHLLLAILELLRMYRLRLPSDLVIVIKALVTAEGTARRIYPDLNVISEAEGYVKGLTAERYKPDALFKGLRSTMSNILSMQRGLPFRFSKIADKIERDEISLRFRHENLGSFRNTLENITNRLAFSIIIAALIIGSSMIITTGIEPLLFGFPALGIIGYIISGLLGLWLIFNLIRSRKY